MVIPAPIEGQSSHSRLDVDNEAITNEFLCTRVAHSVVTSCFQSAIRSSRKGELRGVCGRRVVAH